MTKIAPYHTTLWHYSPEERNVYHNNNMCPAGLRIKHEHREPGMAGRPLCKDCAKLWT